MANNADLRLLLPSLPSRAFAAQPVRLHNDRGFGIHGTLGKRDPVATQTGKTSNRGTAVGGNGKWYAAGLAFSCQQSGNCCSGAPGYVWVTPEEVKAIADLLGRPDGRLGKRYLRHVDTRVSLKEKPNGDCIFLERSDGGCTTCSIHPAKPTQCRTWPFWDYNLASPERWNDAARGCPGINRGNKYTFVQIETQRLMNTPD